MKIALAAVLLLAGAPVAAETVCEGRFVDAARGDRAVPVRVRLPDGDGRVPVVLFSHGLGGSLDAGTRWAQGWAAAGIATVHLQHPGSDQALWRGLSGVQAIEALRGGATPQQFVARLGDVRFVLDRLAQGGTIGACRLDRLDLTRVVMAGHSFGAQTTQAAAGQTFVTAGGEVAFADPRLRAAIAFSPSPSPTVADATAFGKIAMPFLSVTGTDDAVPMLNRVTPADRTRPFAAMPPGGKYLLVLDGADHMIFAGGELRRSKTANDARVETVVGEATLAFLKAVTGPGAPAAVARPATLGSKDRWEAR
jgi:predicted dienelactone hydrolase